MIAPVISGPKSTHAAQAPDASLPTSVTWSYWKTVRKLPAVQRETGRNRISLREKRFARGAYQVVRTAIGAAGASTRKTVALRVR